MNKELVSDYLREFSKSELPDMVTRDLKIPMEGKMSVALIGPRRSGKTFYFFQLIKDLGKDESLYLNFEDTRLSDLRFTEIRDVIRHFIELFGKEPRYLFLDEIQNVENWERAIRELYDTRKYRIFLTGSSSKLLSKEISTQMRGRTMTYMFFPLSFTEFLRFRRFKFSMPTKDEESILKHLLKEYLEFGGFPDVVLSSTKEKILKEYFDSILFKDVVERHGVKNLHLVNLIFRHMVSSFSKEFSVNMLYNTFKSQGVKVSKDTIYRYMNYFEDSASVFFLKRYSEKARLREAWPRKVYLSDTGFSKVIRSSEDMGKLLENCVFLHILRMRNESPLLEVDYHVTQDGKEVDFMIRDASRIKAILQVTYASGPGDIMDRETSNLIMAGRKFGCKDLVVVTWDYEDERILKERTVRFIPLWKILLGRATI